MVSTKSLRIAMKRIVQSVCGVLCEEVRVVTPRLFEPRRYLAQLPAELLPDVYLHIAQNVDVPIPLGGDALYLSEAEAERLQSYSETLPELQFDLRPPIVERQVSEELCAVVE